MAATYAPVSGPIEFTPDPAQTQCRLRLQRDVNTGLFNVTATTDGGTTWRVVFSDPVKEQIGSVPTVGTQGNLGYQAPGKAAVPSSTTPSVAVAVTATTLLAAEITQVGTIYVGQTFGFYQAPAFDVVCSGAQLCLQTAAAGSAVTVVLVQVPSNVETVQQASLASGLEYGATNFNTPLVMPAGTLWRVRVKAVGSTAGMAGECLSVRLNLSPAL